MVDKLYDTVLDKEYVIPEDLESSIGRSRSNSISILDCPASSDVSRKHALFYRNAGKIFIADNNSKLGTFVNHEKVETRRLLHNGDFIGLGPNYLLEARID